MHGRYLNMRKNILIALLAITLAPLVACEKSQDTSSSAPTSSTPSSTPISYETLDGFYQPEQAPRDYENITPLDLKDGDNNTIILVDHAMTNSNWESKTSGSVSISVLGQKMVQDVSSFNIKINNDSVNHAVTTKSNGNVGLAVDLNTAVISYASPDTTYRTISTPSGTAGTMFQHDENTGLVEVKNGGFGSNNWESVANFPMFLEKVGRPTWSFSSYYLPDASAVKSTELLSETESSSTFKVTLNVDPKSGTDAAKYYVNQMKNMTSTVGGLNITIKSMVATLEIPNDSFRPTSMKVEETYTGGLSGMEGDLFSVTNSLTVNFTYFEDADKTEEEMLDELNDPYQKAIFLNAKNGETAPALD